MKISSRLHLAATVLLVVFLLTTVWAGYYLYEKTRPVAAPGPRTLAVFEENGANGFVAALRPSTLYNNSTEIAGGNITLFSPITTWINVSMYFSVLSNRSSSIALHEGFQVILESAVWSKVLFASTNLSSQPDGLFASLVTRYSINVSGVTGLAEEIDTQVGYPSTVFNLELVPSIAGEVTAGGHSEAFSATPLLNLSFEGPLIEPKGLSFTENESLLAPALPSNRGMDAAPYVAFVLSVGALGGSGWLVTRPRDRESVPLDELIAPYEEAIAETAATPKGEVTVPVAEFPDLVKIADTLGKPILRPKGSDPDRAAFIVLDGSIAYAYWHPSGTPGTAAVGESIPLVPVLAASETARIRRLQGEADRLRGLTLDPRTDREARRRIRRAIDLIHAHDQHGADREIDDLSRLLDRAELRGMGS